VSTLSHFSSLDDVKAAFDDAASYAESGDVAMARQFQTAVRILMRRTPRRARHGSTAGGEEIELDHTSLREMLVEVNQWLAARDTATGGSGGGPKFYDISDLRS